MSGAVFANPDPVRIPDVPLPPSLAHTPKYGFTAGSVFPWDSAVNSVQKSYCPPQGKYPE